MTDGALGAPSLSRGRSTALAGVPNGSMRTSGGRRETPQVSFAPNRNVVFRDPDREQSCRTATGCRQ
jgi:hypothetical protein